MRLQQRLSNLLHPKPSKLLKKVIIIITLTKKIKSHAGIHLVTSIGHLFPRIESFRAAFAFSRAWICRIFSWRIQTGEEAGVVSWRRNPKPGVGPVQDPNRIDERGVCFIETVNARFQERCYPVVHLGDANSGEGGLSIGNSDKRWMKWVTGLLSLNPDQINRLSLFTVHRPKLNCQLYHNLHPHEYMGIK